MAKIQEVLAYEILDSRGNPTIAAQINLLGGATGWAAVPSGASTGTREALELRDKDPARYAGKGVLKAIGHILGPIRDAIWGQEFTNLKALDEVLVQLDGTPSKTHLGANAILAVSLAMARAMACEAQQPLYRYLHTGVDFILPVPMMNIINGGAHADNNIDIQEFMILPVGAPSFPEAIRYGAEIFHVLKDLLKKRGCNTAVGDEGGFAPSLRSNVEALDIIMEAIQVAGYQAGKDIYLGLDVASSEFYVENRYCLSAENKKLSAEAFIDLFADWVKHYPILSIEDGMAEQDEPGWKQLTAALGNKIQLVGDDLFVTNTALLRKGIEDKIANAILIKPNQVGTLSETLDAVELAKQAHYNAVMSHRSGETEDTTIADLAVATGIGQIKTGSLCRSDRVAKYNRLLQIAHELGSAARYAGAAVFARWL